jgi:hypothetical protein
MSYQNEAPIASCHESAQFRNRSCLIISESGNRLHPAAEAAAVPDNVYVGPAGRTGKGLLPDPLPGCVHQVRTNFAIICVQKGNFAICVNRSVSFAISSGALALYLSANFGSLEKSG